MHLEEGDNPRENPRTIYVSLDMPTCRLVDLNAAWILRLCLEEIERSRPLFIGLLGDRYGWVPDTTTMLTALEGTGLPPDQEPESVTALEIRYGALAGQRPHVRGIPEPRSPARDRARGFRCCRARGSRCFVASSSGRRD